MTTVRAVIHDRRIELPAPDDLPDGTEVILAIDAEGAEDGAPVSPAEIARVLAAMGRMPPLEIPDDVAAGLDARERKLDRHGIDHEAEDVFRCDDFFSTPALPRRAGRARVSSPGQPTAGPNHARLRAKDAVPGLSVENWAEAV